ncbi:MAR-binding filament-like protein 1 [Nicotiana sylvestris]|uniref:MAR-binding filament-like protein 1 n=1 Tax=Nicotiana sylvestris TaxID=4096 RepID=UPI00388C71E9
MAAPPNFEEGQSTYRPPKFNGQYYGWWKTRMHDFMMAEDSELWDIICDGPYVSMKKLEETGPLVSKGRREYNNIDRKAVEKNYRAKKILMCGIGPNECNRTYEMKRKKDSERREPKKEKNLVLKAESSDSSDKDSDMAYLTKRFQKMEQYKQNPDKAGKRNLVLNKRFNRKSTADNIVKHVLAAWGDSLSESERESDAENSSMMAVETKATKYDSLSVLMAQSDDDDEEEDEDDEVNFRDAQRNLKPYSSKKLRSLSNVLIDAYYSLVNDKEILTVELGEAEQSRDNLVVCVMDLNETIANLEQEKEALNERITSVENERDDLIVVVVDLKETIEGLTNEKHTLEEKVASTEEERDDLLVICTDLEETVEGLNREYRNVSLGKGKEVASESHIMLEKELTVVKTSVCSKLERNQQLQVELEKVRNDLEKSLK